MPTIKIEVEVEKDCKKCKYLSCTQKDPNISKFGWGLGNSPFCDLFKKTLMIHRGWNTQEEYDKMTEHDFDIINCEECVNANDKV